VIGVFSACPLCLSSVHLFSDTQEKQ
jgi:hypothetical protein